MTTMTLDTTAEPRSAWAPLLQNRWLWAFAAALFAVVITNNFNPAQTWSTLGDTDDAARLLQVRNLLEGQGWYDLTVSQIGLPNALVSHWSRIIDAPIALLIVAFETVTSPRMADTLTRIVFPVVFLVLMMRLVSNEAEREAGTLAGILCLALAATSTFATFQFMPGRLDHHHAQILGASGGTLLLFRALRSGGGSWAAGALFGFGLAVGYEALPLVVAILGLAVAFAIFATAWLAPLAKIITALAATLALGLVATAPPGQWFTPACDALGLNLVVFSAIGALSLHAAATPTIANSFVRRVAVLSVGGALAVSAYAALAPACLAGPLGQTDPAIKAIWLDHVREGQSVFSFALTNPESSLIYVLTLVVALGLAGAIWAREGTTVSLFRVAVIALAGLYGGIFVKFFPYVTWLAIAIMAVWIARLPDIGELPARTVRLAALLGLSQSTTLLAAMGLLTLFGIEGLKVDDQITNAGAPGKATSCLLRDDHLKLRELPTGRIANSIDLGPHIAAHTDHRVLAAPYHRIDQSILTLHRISHGDLARAEFELRRLSIDYVVICNKLYGDETDTVSFVGHLKAGGDVPFLEPLPITFDGPLKVWRVKPMALRGSLIH